MSQDGTAQRQHNGQTYRSVGRALALVYREEGLSVLFRGCHVAVLGSVTAWGVYMFIYRSLCGLCSVSFADQACFALIASVVSTILSSPIWLIKSRMQIEDASGVRRYRTFSAGCRHVLQTTGVRSMWRGVSLQLLLVVPNALSFPLYDRMKEALLRRRSDSTVVPVVAHNGLSVADACLCSAVTKGLLVTVSHPIMLLKVRMQDQRWNVGDVQYATVRHSLPLIIKREGVRGIVRGLVPSLMYAVPRGVAHFVLYEKLLALLCRGS
ncbi:putative Mitochondrial carrier protein [Trypanosoma vivax]|nr:putative Mitochondrial carrier protein [Trypanosoma vivax]